MTGATYVQHIGIVRETESSVFGSFSTTAVIFGRTSNGSGVGCTTTVARSSGEGSSAVYNEVALVYTTTQSARSMGKLHAVYNEGRRVRSDVATGAQKILKQVTFIQHHPQLQFDFQGLAMYHGSHECMVALDLEVQHAYPTSFKLEDNRLNHSRQEVRHKPAKIGHYKHRSSRNKNHYTRKKRKRTKQQPNPL
ncbi:hypothetical protein Tco_0608141 [Tanacetum coccineum]